MNFITSIQIGAAACAVAVLAACGGGGGGGNGGPVTSTETFQLRTAYVNYINDSRSLPFTVTGTVSNINVTGSGTVTQGNLTGSTFENQPAQAKTTTVTGSITGNGQTAPLNNSTTAYVDSNYAPLGFSGAEYEVVSSSTAIPATTRAFGTPPCATPMPAKHPG